MGEGGDHRGPAAASGRRSGRNTDERGATLVEFALVAPLLFLLIFGAIDFAWVFSQNVDVKNAAREGGRLAAVNGGPGDPYTTTNHVVTAVRTRSPELTDADTEVSVQLQDDLDTDGVHGERGESVVICVRYPIRSLSGATDMFLGGNLQTKVVMRMEKPASFASGTSSGWPSGVTCVP